MTTWGRSIDALYFEYQPAAGHMEGCPRQGTDVWEVTRFSSYVPSWSEHTAETALRLACHECGAVHFESDLSTETTHAGEIGYASKAEKIAGVFLWPGPRIWRGDDRGPVTYLITATRERPRKPGDVIGKVGWSLGSRGGVRWSAGIGCTEHHTVLVAAGQTWPSRRAAVAWVAENAEDAKRAASGSAR